VSFQRVEALRPELSVGLQPSVDLDEGLWVQRVHALLSLRAHGDESGIA